MPTPEVLPRLDSKDISEMQASETVVQLPQEKPKGSQFKIIINPNGTLTEVSKTDNSILVNRGNRIK